MKKHNLIYYAIDSLKLLFLNNLEVFKLYLYFLSYSSNIIEIKIHVQDCIS